MIKSFDKNWIDGKLIIAKTFFGIGLRLNFKPPAIIKETLFTFELDFLFIRSWINIYKSSIKKSTIRMWIFILFLIAAHIIRS